jgi:uncharacterized protein YndB with AHSA1/START domain
MAEPSKTTCVLVFRRVYDVPIERLWRAWTDPDELGRWYLAGDDHIIHFAEVDLRVGGRWKIAFGPPGKEPYVETNCYTEIVSPTRLSWRGQLTTDGREIPGGEASVLELVDLGGGRTELILTNTGDESLWRHGEGWIPCLNSLERYLS